MILNVLLCDGNWPYYVYKFHFLLNSALVWEQNLNVFCTFYSFGNARMVRSYCEVFISVWFDFLMYQIFYL